MSDWRKRWAEEGRGGLTLCYLDTSEDGLP